MPRVTLLPGEWFLLSPTRTCMARATSSQGATDRALSSSQGSSRQRTGWARAGSTRRRARSQKRRVDRRRAARSSRHREVWYTRPPPHTSCGL